MKHKLGNGAYLVTGASKGIGRAITHALAAKGADLILLARGKKSLDTVAKECREKYGTKSISTYTCDLSDKAQIIRVAKEIQKKHPALKGIIHVAGYALPGYFGKLKPEDFDKSMRTDYLGAVHLTHSLHSIVAEGGLVAFTSSVVGFMGIFGYTAYAGPKFALIGFAESLRQEFIQRKIQVSVLCPPDTETPGYIEENKTKPYETQVLSENAKLMSAEQVAQKFTKKVEKGKFIITCNAESWMFYHLKGIWPSLVFFVIKGIIKKAQKKFNKAR